MENKSGLKRKRGDPWVRFVDPVNPYERQRQDGCPVGLKNVGNTCWFSAVIQVQYLCLQRLHLMYLNYFIVITSSSVTHRSHFNGNFYKICLITK